MPRPTLRRLGAVLATAAAAALAVVAVPATAPSASATPNLSIAVTGNHFVDQNGATVRLLGVNTPSTEYACYYGYAYGNPVADPAGGGGDAAAIADDRTTADAIAAWHANAVRVPLNEDCWLGINGQPSYGTAAGYRQAIADYVTALHQAGLYAILDLHWTDGSDVDETLHAGSGAPEVAADQQRPAPDANSVPFWRSVATAFAGDPAVVFDLFNEPYSPAAIGQGPAQLTWSCLMQGGCVLPSHNQYGGNQTPTYTVHGFQELIDVIRSANANQPIMLGGLSYANDLSGLLANLPSDPQHQLAASFHNYYGEANDTTTAWDNVIAPIASQMPVVTGEFDQGYDCQNGPTTPTSLTTFDNTYMSWADAHGVGYTAWGWWVLDPDPGTTNCSDPRWDGVNNPAPSDLYALIGANGQASTPDGRALHDHLAALAGTPPPQQITVTTTTPHAGYENLAYTAYALKSTGGSGTLSWSVVSGSLPTGMTLSKAGSLAGTPGCATPNPSCPVASSTFTVRVTDTSKPVKSGTATLTVTVNPMTITVPVIKTGRVMVAYPTTTFKVVGGGTPVTWGATGLPPGMKMSTAGAVSGTPTVDGLYDVTITVHNTKTGNAYRSATTHVTFDIEPMVIVGVNRLYPNDTYLGATYSFTEKAVGGKSGWVWSISDGALPPGLKLTSTNGTISGNSTATGYYTFTVHVHDSAVPRHVAEATYTIDVWPMSFYPNVLPAGHVGKAYKTTLIHSGGKGTITYKVTGGAFPAGITMTAAGVISGTPKAGTAGTHPVTITMKDSTTPTPNTATQSYNLYISST